MDPMTLAMLSAGGQAVSNIPGAIASYYGAKDQLRANKQAQGAITDAYGNATSAQQPYQTAGLAGLAGMQGNYDVQAPGAYQTSEQQPTYTPEQFNYQSSPGYGFQMQQGQNAVMGSAAGRGAGLSGATLKALTKYGTGLAAQDYGNEFNRYMQGRQENASDYRTGLGQFNENRDFGATQQQNAYQNANQQATQKYSRAQNLAGVGQTAAGNLANLATDYGSNLAGLYGAKGNIQSSQKMGLGQIAGDTLGSLANNYLSAYTMNQSNPKYVANAAFNKTYGKLPF